MEKLTDIELTSISSTSAEPRRLLSDANNIIIQVTCKQQLGKKLVGVWHGQKTALCMCENVCFPSDGMLTNIASSP